MLAHSSRPLGLTLSVSPGHVAVPSQIGVAEAVEQESLDRDFEPIAIEQALDGPGLGASGIVFREPGGHLVERFPRVRLSAHPATQILPAWSTATFWETAG